MGDTKKVHFGSLSEFRKKTNLPNGHVLVQPGEYSSFLFLTSVYTNLIFCLIKKIYIIIEMLQNSEFLGLPDTLKLPASMF